MGKNKCVPKNFLCKYPLGLGAFVVGGVMIIILIILAIATLCQILYMKKDCDQCGFYIWRNCYAYSITSFIYVFMMICANLWFFWGINKKKASVVLSWIVISSMWLFLAFCLLIVLMSLHIVETSNTTASIIILICGLIAIAILLYGEMVIVGYWMELKESKEPAQP